MTLSFRYRFRGWRAIFLLLFALQAKGSRLVSSVLASCSSFASTLQEIATLPVITSDKQRLNEASQQLHTVLDSFHSLLSACWQQATENTLSTPYAAFIRALSENEPSLAEAAQLAAQRCLAYKQCLTESSRNISSEEVGETGETSDSEDVGIRSFIELLSACNPSLDILARRVNQGAFPVSPHFQTSCRLQRLHCALHVWESRLKRLSVVDDSSPALLKHFCSELRQSTEKIERLQRAVTSQEQEQTLLETEQLLQNSLTQTITTENGETKTLQLRDLLAHLCTRDNLPVTSPSGALVPERDTYFYRVLEAYLNVARLFKVP